MMLRPLVCAVLAGSLLAPVAALALPATPALAATATYEVEDGALSGVSVSAAEPGFSGRGYVTGFDDAADSVTVTVPGGASGGLYDLTARYRSPFGAKQSRLVVNGVPAGDLALPSSAGFAETPAGRVLLRAGDNQLTFQSNWGFYDLDAVRLTPAPPRPAHQLRGTPVDPAATPAARGLLSYLGAHYGRDLISGQQDAASIDWIERNVGTAPAIGGFDLMDYSPSRVERGATGHDVDDALAWDRRGGITTLVWHWNAPAGLVDQPGREWWRGFYADATTFDLAAALADPSGPGYQLLLRDIDAIAVQLRRLSDAGVPVLWRPLHEAEGGLFWWGAQGPGPAKQLYRLMYDRLVHHDQLHNLIWVWNSVSPDWYPGDDVVDVLSADSYPAAGDHGPVSGTYERLVTLGGDRVPVALSEVGAIPDPALTRAYQADWSYFVTWGGEFASGGSQNSLDFLRSLYADPHVITLGEVGDFKRPAGGTGAIGGPGGLCVDVAGANPASGTPVILWNCIGGAAQAWTAPGDGTLRALGKCLDVTSTAATGWGTRNGTPVELWDCWGGGPQQWVRQPDGSLRNPASGRCLDDPAGDTSPGVRLQIWDCNGLPPQAFTGP